MNAGEEPQLPARGLDRKRAASVLAKGFCMGIADVIPGVSGGTMAFILGIYQRLLEAIRAFDLQLITLLGTRRWSAAVERVDLLFLLLLGGGIFAALLFFTRVVPLPSLIVSHPVPIYSLFFGLIAASIQVLLATIGRPHGGEWIWWVAGAATGLIVVNLVPVETPDSVWFIFICGAVAICALILPGISGSFVLLILKKYAYVLDAIGRFDMTVVLPFALGAITGLLAFSRVLVWCLRHYYRQSIAYIVGILVGSLWVIWPFQERVYETVRGRSRLVHSEPTLPATLDAMVVGAITLALLGAALVLILARLAGRPRKPDFSAD